VELEGKTAVITGAASGIGLATAHSAARAGARLVLADIEPEPLEKAVADLRHAGAAALGVVTDVSKEDDVVALREAALGEFGAVHLVVNNAGVAAGGAAIGTPTAIWEWILSVNVNGVIYGLNAFLPLLLAQDEGWIVNTASLAGLGGGPGMGPYCASKFAVVGLSESLFHDLRLRGSRVGVSVLCPGFVRTRINQSERVMPRELASYLEDPTAKYLADMATAAVEAGIEPALVGDEVVRAVEGERFWILPHERVALRTTELRLEWMRGGPPMNFDLQAATRP